MASRVRSPLRGRETPLRGSRQAPPDPVDDSAEVVVLGEILGATGFGEECKGSVLCKWAVVHGEHWTIAAGDASGATQAASPSPHGGELAAWSHPIQLSFKTTSVQVRRSRHLHDNKAHAPSTPKGERWSPVELNGRDKCFLLYVSPDAARSPRRRATPPDQMTTPARANDDSSMSPLACTSPPRAKNTNQTPSSVLSPPVQHSHTATFTMATFTNTKQTF